jgi:hypothetical protein
LQPKPDINKIIIKGPYLPLIISGAALNFKASATTKGHFKNLSKQSSHQKYIQYGAATMAFRSSSKIFYPYLPWLKERATTMAALETGPCVTHLSGCIKHDPNLPPEDEVEL